MYLALADGPASFTQGFTCPMLLWINPGRHLHFEYRAITFYGTAFQLVSSMKIFCNFLRPEVAVDFPNPVWLERKGNSTFACEVILLSSLRFGLFPFRSPLLREYLFSICSFSY